MVDGHEARYREAERRLWASLGVVPRERRIHLATLACDVRVQEVGEGDAVVFMHGASTAGTSWASLAAAMPGRSCLLVDRPGTGLSAPLPRPPRSDAEMRAFGDLLLPDLLDGLELEQAPVVATSLGGYFAFRGAIAAPGRVARIVEVGWTPAAPTASPPLFMRIGSVPFLGAALARLPAGESTVRRLLRQIGLREALDSGRVSSEAVAAYAALLNHTPTMRHELDLGRRMVSPLHGLRAGLALTAAERVDLALPVLVLWGDRDPFGTLEVARAFVGGMPEARLVEMAGAGHAPWMDDASSVASIVDAFLAGGSS